MTDFARAPQLVGQLVGSRDVIAFSAAMARMIGDVEATVFMCQACYWQSKVGDKNWFYKLRDAERDSEGRMVPPSDASRQSWEWETALPRARQESARRRLKALGLLDEDRRGVPAKLYYRVNFERLYQLLLQSNQLAETPPTGWSEVRLQGGGNSTDKPAEAPPTIRTQTTAQTNAETTTTTALHNDIGGPPLVSHLIFDRTVSQHRKLLTALLARLPVEAAQDIADELAGALEEVSRGKRIAISSIRGWVLDLVQRWQAGSFQLDSGKTVQARRAEIREAAAHSATTQRSRSKGAEEQLQLVRRMTNARPVEQRLSSAE
ncbi:hypothetical protein [Ralstonia insidiosa]|uniref:Uncharacterized protein n=1 Tax=Ralstonia insidiosa TaxID=190721 RepID=A0A848NPF5_9RALS|nr:hypothetical protein [Ralstonia insidiosa]NMV37022.1 hypothetical protein [Ralstonia insidiosa]